MLLILIYSSQTNRPGIVPLVLVVINRYFPSPPMRRQSDSFYIDLANLQHRTRTESCFSLGRILSLMILTILMVFQENASFYENPKEDYLWIATIGSLGFPDKDDFVPTYFSAAWNMQGFLLDKVCNGKEIRQIWSSLEVEVNHSISSLFIQLRVF